MRVLKLGIYELRSQSLVLIFVVFVRLTGWNEVELWEHCLLPGPPVHYEIPASQLFLRLKEHHYSRHGFTYKKSDGYGEVVTQGSSPIYEV